MPNSDFSYHEQISRYMIKQQRLLLQELPRFLSSFFRGIDTTTAPRTRVGYARDLKIFFEFIIKSNPIYENTKITDLPLTLLDELMVSDLEEFMEYLKLYKDTNDTEISNKEHGVKRKMSSIRAMYNYFYSHELIKNNPASIVKMPKIHEKEIIRFDENEMYDFLDKVEMGTNLSDRQKKMHEKTKTRDLAIMTLLLGTGIRVSECVGLDINDINIKDASIKIVRKGGNEDIVFIGDEVEKRLTEYLLSRKEIVAMEGHEEALFLSGQKRRLTVRAVEKLVEKYAKITDTLKHITPHKLRSTFGTQLYRQTQDIYLVADILGHKDVNTTKKHYATVDLDKKRDARNKVKLRDEDNI